MIGVIYLGNNPANQERLKYIPGHLVRLARNYKDAAVICEQRASADHYILFLEKGNKNEDIVSISYLRKRFPR